MLRLTRILTFSLSLLLFASAASAHQSYTFIDHKCRAHSGFVINIDDGQIQLLNLDGHFEAIHTLDVETIMVFDFVSNPLTSIDMTPQLLEQMRVINLGQEGESEFLAWPVRFMDSLVMFYDQHGKTHVFEMDAIHKLRPVTNFEMGRYTLGDGVKPRLDLENASLNCPSLVEASVKDQASTELTRPTRVLSDTIKIQQFLQDFETSFRELESFQERTYLYAKPYLYDRNDRFGFVFFPNGAERKPDIPIFFQWATGSPYRFQSFTLVGANTNEFAPNTEPFAQIRSDLKAHVFHALFVGNLSGLSAGTSIYASGLGNTGTYKTYGVAESQVGLNYMALLGGDYGPYSLSVGSFFPSIGIRSGTAYREILSSRILCSAYDGDEESLASKNHRRSDSL